MPAVHVRKLENLVKVTGRKQLASLLLPQPLAVHYGGDDSWSGNREFLGLNMKPDTTPIAVKLSPGQSHMTLTFKLMHGDQG